MEGMLIWSPELLNKKDKRMIAISNVFNISRTLSVSIDLTLNMCSK
jgi:hypothetical protein